PLGGDPDLEAKLAKLNEELATLRRMSGTDELVKKKLAEIKKVQGQVPSTLVVRERSAPRTTHVQLRGDFLRPGDEVTPGFPAALSTSPVSAGPAKRLTRLDLATWLVSAENPLTARVTINREWQKFFGRGLVETENDFGMQGSPPTHPELLDWLSVEFRENGWSTKKLHRLIVTSATYRQSSAARADLHDKDPQNKLLGRQS